MKGKTAMKKFLAATQTKFVISGAVNTIFTYAIYLFTLLFFPYELAFTLAYSIGIVSSYTINTIYVFHESWVFRKLLHYPLVYIIQYSLSLLLLIAFVDYASLPKELGPILITILLLPVSYLTSKFIIKR